MLQLRPDDEDHLQSTSARNKPRHTTSTSAKLGSKPKGDSALQKRHAVAHHDGQQRRPEVQLRPGHIQDP
jgi:hypothetical protein